MKTNITSFHLDGYFTEGEAKTVCELMEGRTFYNFHCNYSNSAGNCTIVIWTEYEPVTVEMLKGMFVHCLITTLVQIKKEVK